MHMQRPAHLFMYYYTGGSFGFDEVKAFWILHFGPFQKATLFHSLTPKQYLIVLFSVSLQTPIHPVYFQILLILQRSRANK